VQQEIDTLTAEKRLEFRIMSCMPMGILAYVALTSKEFVTPLFETIAGRIVLGICALLYLTFFMIGKRIIEIDV
ncbi:MAG: type II secretion system protein F, partial [Bacteroidaceae bacterium]|nr:type II secretion system protein F [Bacteroidaceae bacterium]